MDPNDLAKTLHAMLVTEAILKQIQTQNQTLGDKIANFDKMLDGIDKKLDILTKNVIEIRTDVAEIKETMSFKPHVWYCQQS